MTKQNKTIIGVSVAGVVAILGYLFYRSKKSPNLPTHNVGSGGTTRQPVNNPAASSGGGNIGKGLDVVNKVLDLFGKSNKPAAPIANMEGDLRNDNWDDLGGYSYLFSDGSQDYYLADGTYVESRDVNGDLQF